MCAVIRYVTVYYMLHKVELPFVYTYKKTKPWMNFPGLDLVRTLFKFKTRKENLSSFVQSRPLENVVSGIFHVQVVQLWSKKCTKKRKAGRMSVNSCCFTHITCLPPPPIYSQTIFTVLMFVSNSQDLFTLHENSLCLTHDLLQCTCMASEVGISSNF